MEESWGLQLIWSSTGSDRSQPCGEREESCCRTMFQHWLEGNGRQPASWTSLLEVLRDSEFISLAAILAGRPHSPPTPLTVFIESLYREDCSPAYAQTKYSNPHCACAPRVNNCLQFLSTPRPPFLLFSF